MPFQPYFFNDSPTVLERLYQCIIDVLKLKKDVGDLGDFLREVNRKIDELDEDIAQAVQNALQALIDGGDVQNMINAAMESGFTEWYNAAKNYTNLVVEENNIFNANKQATVDFERMFRTVKDTAHYMFNQPSISQAADDTRTEKLSFAQGGCHFYENGEDRFAIMYISNDGSKFSEGGSAYTGNALIEVYNRSGVVIRSKTILGVAGHAQTLCYHNGFFYFEGHNPLDEYAFRKIRRISADLTSNVDSYLMPYGFNGLASYGGMLWITYATNTEIDVWKVEMQSDGVTPTTNVIDGRTMNPSYIGFMNTGGYRNTVFSAGFSVTGQYFYFGTHNPTGILRCKRYQTAGGTEDNFKPDYWYSIPDMLNDRELKTGELEFMTIYDDFTCYIGTTQHMNTKAVCMGDITQVFAQNLKYNTCMPVQFENPKTGRKQIYCKDPTLSAGGISTNPFGTSYDDAFTRIDEACWYFNNNEKYNYGVFNLNGSFGHLVWCSAGKSYRFDGDSNPNPHANFNGEKYTLLGNLVQFGGDVTCYGCVFTSSIHYLAASNPNLDTAGLMASYKNEKENPIYSCDGNINLINSGALWSYNPNIKGGLYIRNAVGNYNYTNVSQNYTQAAFVQYAGAGKYFMNVGNSTINLHGDVGLTTNGSMNIAAHNVLNPSA